MYYDGKIIATTNGNHYVGVQSSSASTQAHTTNSRRPCLPPPSTPVSMVSVNGRRSMAEGRAVFYNNAVFEGGGCEFNPGARSSAPNGLGLYNGKTNGSLGELLFSYGLGV